ncbi:MAG TPA: contractile injection system protein, VgrG/Pvc8 family [Beijerinckiaceae bacterium]|nr:contractile injection system protein, VgrG/Pvc8 family [Beijerinckiaceae bacterium]
MAETSVSAAAVYRARPTLRLAGAEDERASELLVGMRLEESEGGMSALELRFSNWASLTSGGAEYAFGAGARLRLGAEITVSAGDETQPREIFRGIITAVEGEYATGKPPELTVLAEDALQRARMARRSRIHTDKSPADVARAIASDLGLRPVISGLAAPVGMWAQLNESDLSFLRRLIGRFDGDLQIVGQEMHVAPRADIRRGAIDLELHGQLARASLRVDLADQVTAITTRGWNATQGSAVSGSAGRLTHGGPGRGRDGAALLAELLQQRSEHLGHVVVTTDAEARAVAEAAFDLRARRLVTLEGITEGNPQLRVGSHCTITGVDHRFENTYYVVRVCHRYDLREGYRCEFSAECAYLGDD